ncbi:hypothetical protein [Nocardia sp. NPDC058666]|uniref:hypothetical protein n=1 Tax=unclassified Nocardia TaxID=2637762 RepID=UPI00364696B3
MDVPTRARRAEATVYALFIAVIAGMLGLLTWAMSSAEEGAPTWAQMVFVTISSVTVAVSIFSVVVLWAGHRMKPLVRTVALSILVLNSVVFVISASWLALETEGQGISYLLILVLPIGMGMARVIYCVPAAAR